jgi:hypothetical protein
MNTGAKGPNNRAWTRDIRGQFFGSLKALEPTGKLDQCNTVIWRCLCTACGTETYLSTAALRRRKSCGCAHRNALGTIQDRLHFIDGTCVEILEKRKHRADNTSGHRGVYYIPKTDRWRAGIRFKGHGYHLGVFNTFDEAKQARLDAEDMLYKPFLESYYALHEPGALFGQPVRIGSTAP